MRRALAVHERNLVCPRRFGIEGGIIWNIAEVAFDSSSWADGTPRSRSTMRRSPGSKRAHPTTWRCSTGRADRGSGWAGATWRSPRADAERAVDAGREAGDPQALLPCLAERAQRLLAAGRGEEAEADVSEILDPNASRTVAGLVLVDRPRGIVVLTQQGRGTTSWRWEARISRRTGCSAARLWASDDLAGAADLFQEMGAAPDEAYAA